MKKLFILSLLLAPVCVFADDVLSINGVEEPQWKNFAPPAYVDVTEPKGFGKFNDTAAYWYKRKVDFEQNRENCRNSKNAEEMVTCYQQLKVKQYQKNSDYNARLEAIENAKKNPLEMNNMTTDMIPINGYLNNFSRFQPNELR